MPIGFDAAEVIRLNEMNQFDVIRVVKLNLPQTLLPIIGSADFVTAAGFGEVDETIEFFVNRAGYLIWR